MKSQKLCSVEGCKNRHDKDNYLCIKHSIMYYGKLVPLAKSSNECYNDVMGETL